MDLLIVESPTKAKTISKFLNKKEYSVTSSFGHMRDLPVKKLGVDVEKNFEPEYVIPEDKKDAVTKLKTLAKKANNIIFATDEDREGEAIAWHLLNILNEDSTEHKRIVFHEITKKAITEALGKARKIDTNLVDAQQARRVLDRLVGYELSPFLWKAVTRGLSAGRVQSVVVRLIVEKEEEIKKFNIEEYWTVDGNFSKTKQKEMFPAKLDSIDGKKLEKLELKDKKVTDKILLDLKNGTYQIAEIKKRETKKKPNPPFTTSTLQQAGNRRMGFSAKQTMFVAQKLYEGIDMDDLGHVGLITYMRTDSLNLADSFLEETKTYLQAKLGDKYATDVPRYYKTKSKGAQEAHEAIRPTDVNLDPDKVRQYLDDKQFKLYSLIWQRAVASQMPSTLIDSTTANIVAEGKEKKYNFKATGSIVKFDGFTKIYPTDTKQELLPKLESGDKLNTKKLEGIQHFTQPPARYSEASLVKKLEELGIGRPSTYAPTISTVQDRGYVKKIEKNLKPTDVGEVVNKVLLKNFPNILEYNFTASVENELDDIATGKLKWRKVIRNFYNPFKKHLEKTMKNVSNKDLEEKTDEKCDKCGQGMIIKIGRFGKFMACSNYPDCKNTKQVAGSDDEEDGEVENLGKCPDCDKELTKKHGRFGAFIGCSGYPDCKYIQKNKLKETGIKCSTCKEGDLVEKKTRRGKLFYACSKYPKCDQAYWNKPTKDKCPDCKGLVTETLKGQKKCENKECKSNTEKDKKS